METFLCFSFLKVEQLTIVTIMLMSRRVYKVGNAGTESYSYIYLNNNNKSVFSDASPLLLLLVVSMLFLYSSKAFLKLLLLRVLLNIMSYFISI